MRQSQAYASTLQAYNTSLQGDVQVRAAAPWQRHVKQLICSCTPVKAATPLCCSVTQLWAQHEQQLLTATCTGRVWLPTLLAAAGDVHHLPLILKQLLLMTLRGVHRKCCVLHPCALLMRCMPVLMRRWRRAAATSWRVRRTRCRAKWLSWAAWSRARSGCWSWRRCVRVCLLSVFVSASLV